MLLYLDSIMRFIHDRNVIMMRCVVMVGRKCDRRFFIDFAHTFSIYAQDRV